MGDYFTKHHLPHHHRKIRATCLYMSNALLKIDHKIMHEWANAVITPIHTVEITQNSTVLQGCSNGVCTFGHTNTITVT